jgi:serine/threonine-protein kinase
MAERESSADTLVPADTQVRDDASKPTLVAFVDTVSVPESVEVDVVRPVDQDGPGASRYGKRDTLGQGGMGEVILCLDRRIGRDVAMKIVRSEQISSEVVHRRFLREARVQGQLEHPSIVPVYDLGRSPDGTAYFTMKRLKGLTLAQVLSRLVAGDAEIAARFSSQRLLQAFTQVCQAIDYAHQRGVVHRDLKPANIMLGDYGEVWVLDWGLARIASDAEELPAAERVMPTLDRTPATIAGAVMGTPGYMAPEQVKGRQDQIGPWTDIYALGAVLFEMLSLQPLHEGSNVQAVLLSTLSVDGARPSARSPQRPIAPELDAICARATALEPSDRYRGARELHRALVAYLDGDRDTELRQTLAKRHSDAAEVLAERVLAGEDALRPQTMVEVGKALALDPKSAAAVEVLMKLLASPPRTIPPEVEANIVQSDYDRERLQSRVGAYT